MANTPSQAITDSLNLICFSANGSPPSPAMLNLCSAFLNVDPTAGELEAFVNELAPKEIEGQNQLSATIAAQKIDNIRKHLAALRQGTTGVDTSRFSLNIGVKKVLVWRRYFNKTRIILYH